MIPTLCAVFGKELIRHEDAFDVIGELTFGKSLGFLEKGGDIDGIIVALEHMLDYSGKVSSSTHGISISSDAK